MKTAEMKQLSAEDLAKTIVAAKKELQELKLKHASRVEVEKPGRMREMRRNIARLLTVQSAAKKEAK